MNVYLNGVIPQLSQQILPQQTLVHQTTVGQPGILPDSATVEIAGHKDSCIDEGKENCLVVPFSSVADNLALPGRTKCEEKQKIIVSLKKEKSLELSTIDELIQSIEDNTCDISVDFSRFTGGFSFARKMIKLADAISLNTILINLNLSNTRADLTEVGRALCTNGTIFSLNFSDNQRVNLADFSVSLAENRIRLRTLNLSGCGISSGAGDVSILANMLKVNTSLEYLILQRNPDIKDVSLFLSVIQTRNNKLRMLDLYYTGVHSGARPTDANVVKIDEILKKRR